MSSSAAGFVAGHDLDLGAVRNWVGKVGEHAVDPHRDRLLGERLGDALGHRRSRRAGRKIAFGAVGKRDRDHGFPCASRQSGGAAFHSSRVEDWRPFASIRRDRAPGAVAPRPIPARILRQDFRHGVEAVRAERAAAREARKSHPAAAPKPETADRDVGIFGAGRQMPAGAPRDARKRVAIELDQPAREKRRQPDDAAGEAGGAKLRALRARSCVCRIRSLRGYERAGARPQAMRAPGQSTGRPGTVTFVR